MASLTAVLMVVSGGLYALLFALARLRRRRALDFWAYGAYALFFAATLLFSRALQFSGYWLVLTVLLVLGYLGAPLLVWRLCRGTHAHSSSAGDNSA